MGILVLEDGVLEDLHDVSASHLVVEGQFFLTGHGCVAAGSARPRVLLQPPQELLVLLLRVKGVEDVGGLAEESVHHSLTHALHNSAFH